MTARTVTFIVFAAIFSGLSQTEGDNVTLTWERVVAAKGGRSRLHAVHTLVIRTNDLAPGGDQRFRRAVGTVQYEFVRAFPDRSWTWEDYRPGQMGFAAEVFNISRRLNWESRRGGKAVPLRWSDSSERALRSRLLEDQLIYLLETRFAKPTLRKTWRDGDTVMIEGEAPGLQRLIYVIDGRSMLPRSITLTPAPVALPDKPGLHPVPSESYEFDRYTSVDGIQMPSQVKGLGEVSFTVNPDIDPKLFETPPDGVTSRDEWRKYLKK